MKKCLALIFLLSIFILLFDFLWLSYAYANFYQPLLPNLFTGHVNYLAAACFYIIYVIGVFYFVIHKSVTKSEVIVRGFFLGLLCYSTYDLTNHATIPNWPFQITLIDISWGGLMTSASSFLACTVYEKICDDDCTN